MRMLRSAALVVLLAPFSNGCGDSCGDIACLPAPIPLEVIVSDTISVRTTIRRLEGTDSIDVDTTEIRRAATTAATVSIITENGTTRDTLGTLQLSDTLYHELDLARIPDGEFRLLATRGERGFLSSPLLKQHVGGCCPYSIVGRFTLSLPADTID